MDATELPELRRQLHQQAEAYRAALSDYFALATQPQPPPGVRAAAHHCRDVGAAYDRALGALIDALWFHLDDEALAAEQRRLEARRVLLAAELRLLA